MADEVNTQQVRFVDRQEASNSVEIRKGSNFSWGFTVKKEEEEKKEETKDEEDEALTAEKDCIPKTFDDLLVLKDLNLSVKKGEFVCVIGDTGAGKTSLLLTIAGDLLFASPEFAQHFRNISLDKDSIADVKEKLTMFSNNEIL